MYVCLVRWFSASTNWSRAQGFHVLTVLMLSYHGVDRHANWSPSTDTSFYVANPNKNRISLCELIRKSNQQKCSFLMKILSCPSSQHGAVTSKIFRGTASEGKPFQQKAPSGLDPSRIRAPMPQPGSVGMRLLRTEGLLRFQLRTDFCKMAREIGAKVQHRSSHAERVAF